MVIMAPSKEDRVKCYSARDDYWKCLDTNDLIRDDTKKLDCSKLRKLYTNLCPSVWVTHFDRKYKYEKFKAREALENQRQLDS